MASDDRILLGRIGAAHGIKGEVRLKSYTDPVEAITEYGALEAAAGGAFTFERWRVQKGALIARFTGVTDRNKAETLNGTDLYIARDRLPETDDGEFYHADLIGLLAIDTDGAETGRIVAVQDFGAGDLLEIKPDGTPSVFLPFTEEAVPEIDIAAGRVVIDPPEGFFGGDDDDEPGPDGSAS